MGVGLTSVANAQSLTKSSPGFHYFYKAGVGMDAHDVDLVTCSVAIRGLVNGSDAMTGLAAGASDVEQLTTALSRKIWQEVMAFRRLEDASQNSAKQ